MTDKIIVIREVYKIHPKFDDIEILNYGMWTKRDGIVLDSTMPIWERRANMKKLKFR